MFDQSIGTVGKQSQTTDSTQPRPVTTGSVRYVVSHHPNDGKGNAIVYREVIPA